MTTESSPGHLSARGAEALATTKPASAMVQHTLGRPVPRRPELAAAPTDFQDAPGAPDVGEHGDNPVTGFSEFYKAEGWLSTTNDIPDEDDIVSGCEHQGAIKLPRQTFSCAMNLLCLAWIVAAFYFAFVISKATLIQKHAFFERTRPGLRDRHLTSLLGLNVVEEHLATEDWPCCGMMLGKHGRVEERAKDEFGYLQLWMMQFFDLLRVSWPHENVLPQAFACDADGRQFVVSDGLSLFSARLQTPLEPKAPLIAKFLEAEIACLPGESLLDATVRCSDTTTADRCEALVLHRSGRRLSSCRLGNGTGMSRQGSAEGREISDAWLEELRSSGAGADRAPHARVEKAVTLTSQTHCTGDNCILLGTSRGRLVRLGMSSSSKLTPTTLGARSGFYETFLAGA
eukprot:s187_g7.t1